MVDLGKIENIPLKDLWPGEATHFTPWLSENLEVLGEKLGMDLELQSTETAAGDFAADILAKDSSTGRLVIVENQFGGTDHRHLGQIITYASVLGAKCIVWIAEQMRPEHKAAIDFLNQNLRETLSVYAVEASAMRIDGSKPAFVLTIVSAPSDSLTSGEESPAVSETAEKYRAYFQTLIDELREVHKFTNARAGQLQSWYTFASENSRVFKYSTSFARGGKVRVEIYIDCGDKDRNKQLFDCLAANRGEIEAAVESQLSWERLDNRSASRIAMYRDGDIDADSETLAQIRSWAIKNLLKFKNVFPKRIQQRLASMPSKASTPSAS